MDPAGHDNSRCLPACGGFPGMLARLERRGNATVIHRTAPRQVHGRATERRQGPSARRRSPRVAVHRSTSCPARSAVAAPPHQFIAAPPHEFPTLDVGNSITAPSAAMTSALRGWPLARCVTCPSGPSTNVVGVRRTPSRLTRSSCDSASISMCVTPSIIAATSDSTCLVARQGAQKAEENCTRVARSPSAAPRSALLSRAAAEAGGSSAGPAPARAPGAADTLPLCARHQAPMAVATTSAPSAAASPGVTAGKQHVWPGHSRPAWAAGPLTG